MNCPEIKIALPFFQRADELEVKEPIVAYYCKYQGLKLAISVGSKSRDVNIYLEQVMNELENDKKMLSNDETFTNEDVTYAYIENFALRIFTKADNEDRAGKANKLTAKSFFAASIFLEVLRTFGEYEPGIEDKIKYSKFKTVDILKAIKEGRVPHPGSLTEDITTEININPENELDLLKNEQEKLTNLGLSRPEDTSSLYSTPTTPVPPATIFLSTTESIVQSAQIPGHSTLLSQLKSTVITPHQDIFQKDLKPFMDAQKHAKFAISALQYDDIATAVMNLQKALDILTPHLK